MKANKMHRQILALILSFSMIFGSTGVYAAPISDDTGDFVEEVSETESVVSGSAEEELQDDAEEKLQDAAEDELPAEEMADEIAEETAGEEALDTVPEEDSTGAAATWVYVACEEGKGTEGVVLDSSNPDAYNQSAHFEDGVLTLYRSFSGNNQMKSFGTPTMAEGRNFYDQACIYAEGDLIIEVANTSSDNPLVIRGINDQDTGNIDGKHYARRIMGIYVAGNLTIRNSNNSNAGLKVTDTADNLVYNSGYGGEAEGIYCTEDLTFETQGGSLTVISDMTHNTGGNYISRGIRGNSVTVGGGVTVNTVGRDMTEVVDYNRDSCGIYARGGNVLIKKGSNVTASGGNFPATGDNTTVSAGLYSASGKVIIEDGAIVDLDSGTVNSAAKSVSGEVVENYTAVETSLSSVTMGGLYYYGEHSAWSGFDTEPEEYLGAPDDEENPGEESLDGEADLGVPSDLMNFLKSFPDKKTKKYKTGTNVTLDVLLGEDFYNVPKEISDKYMILAMEDSLCKAYKAGSKNFPLPLKETTITLCGNKTYNLCFAKREDLKAEVTSIELEASDLSDTYTLEVGGRVPKKDSGDDALRITSFSPCVQRAYFDHISVAASPYSTYEAAAIENNKVYYACYKIGIKDGFYTRLDADPPTVWLNGKMLMARYYETSGGQLWYYAYKKLVVGTPQKLKLSFDKNGRGELPDWAESSIQFDSGLCMQDFLTGEQLDQLYNIPCVTDASGKRYNAHWTYEKEGEVAEPYDIYSLSDDILFEDLTLVISWHEMTAVTGNLPFTFGTPAAGMIFKPGAASMEPPESGEFDPVRYYATGYESYQTEFDSMYTDKDLSDAHVMKEGEAFESGRTYYAKVGFKVIKNNDYYIDPADLPVITVNGEKAELKGGEGEYYFVWSFTPGKDTVNVVVDLNYPDGRKGMYVMTGVPAGTSENGGEGYLDISSALLSLGSMTWDQYLKYAEEFKKDGGYFWEKHPLKVSDTADWHTDGEIGLKRQYRDFDDMRAHAYDEYYLQYLEDTVIYLQWYKVLDSIVAYKIPVPHCGDSTSNHGEQDINRNDLPVLTESVFLGYSYEVLAPGFEYGNYWYTNTVNTTKALGDGGIYNFVAGQEYLLHYQVQLGYGGEAFSNDLWEKCIGEKTKLLYAGKSYDGIVGRDRFNRFVKEFLIPVTAEHRDSTGTGITETVIKYPTCEEDGKAQRVSNYTCAGCSVKVDETEEIVTSRLGHSWGPWETVKEPTETEEGLAKRVCKNDAKHTETKVLPKLEKENIFSGAGVFGVALGSNSLTLKMGEKVKLDASVFPENAPDPTLIWKSDNTEVASVDSDGVVYGKKPGKAKITATAKDGGAFDECEVTVLKQSAGDDENTRRISEEDLEGYVFGDRVTKVITGTAVKLGDKDVTPSVSVNYINAAAYNGGAIKADKEPISAKLSFDGMMNAAGLSGKDATGLFKVSYKYKKNKTVGKDAQFYPVIKKLDNKTAKTLNLTARDKKNLKKLIKVMNKAFKADPCTFTINKASLADLKESMELKAKFDKDGKIKLGKGDAPKIKSLKAKLDPNAKKAKKIAKTMYVVESTDLNAGTVRITGKKNFTGTVTLTAVK